MLPRGDEDPGILFSSPTFLLPLGDDLPSCLLPLGDPGILLPLGDEDPRSLLVLGVEVLLLLGDDVFISR